MSRKDSERRKPVLIVQHAQYEHPAAVRRALESQGILTQWIHPYRGEAYPELSEIRGMISLGGPMGANDDEKHPWIREELKLLRATAEAEMPTVGICLGGQMLAKALGARVERHSTVEVGWFPIQLNKDGKEDRILGAAGTTPIVYHWHQDTFHLPPGAQLLAKSKVTERQAYRIGELAYGFQFHPEADHQLVHEWLAIEGVEDEIREVRDVHGARTVQDADTQREVAARGEKASLKITTAITQLFKDSDYQPVSKQYREMLEAAATHRTRLLLQFEGSDRTLVSLRGHISTFLTLPDGEFVIFKEENTLLWPIRLDHIVSLVPASR